MLIEENMDLANVNQLLELLRNKKRQLEDVRSHFTLAIHMVIVSVKITFLRNYNLLMLGLDIQSMFYKQENKKCTSMICWESRNCRPVCATRL